MGGREEMRGKGVRSREEMRGKGVGSREEMRGKGVRSTCRGVKKGEERKDGRGEK